MSYIKNCTVCGERISLREMSHGQWVAFDVNTDKPHKHKKGSKKRKPPKNGASNGNLDQSPEPTSNAPKIIISVIVILLIIYLLN